MLRWIALAGLMLAAGACGSKQGAQQSKATSGAGKATPVAKSSTDAGPTLDELRIAAIQKAINETKAQRHTCWAKASANTLVAGTVTLKLTFSKMKIKSVVVANDSAGSEVLGDCLMALYKAYGWQPVFTDDAAIRLPFQFLQTKGQYTIHADDVKKNLLSGTDLQVKVLLHEGNTGHGAAALSMLTLTDGLRVPMHQHTSAELLYFVAGGGTLINPGRTVRIKPGMAVYIPAGVPHEFVHDRTAPATAMQLYVPAGPEQRFRGGSGTGTKPATRRDVKLARKGPRPYAVQSSKAKRHGLGGGKLGTAALVLDGLKNKAASFQMLTLTPGAFVPKHTHPTSTEIIYMDKGQGVVTIAGTAYPVKAGHAIQIPAGLEHSFRVGAKTSVMAYQFYVGSGPEQRFKKTK